MIEVVNLNKTFVSNKKFPGLTGAIKGLFSREKVEKLAVKDINFKINEGEIVGFVGSNGAGKSTTIKMMTGILYPTSGKCLINGIEPYKDRKANAQNIGVVFGQRTQLWWDLPLFDTFEVLKEIYQVSDEDFKERMEFLNAVLNLDEFMSSTVRTLSLGQRMRADLAAALIHNPKIIYLDEPTIGLDIVVKEKIINFIKEVNQKYNTTIVLTTHDMSDIEQLCERMVMIDSGSIIYDGSIKNLREKFGAFRTLTLDVEDATVIKDIDFLSELGLTEEDFIPEFTEKQVIIKFNRNKTSLVEIMDRVGKNTTIRDIHIAETDISHIVKRIYTEGV